MGLVLACAPFPLMGIGSVALSYRLDTLPIIGIRSLSWDWSNDEASTVVPDGSAWTPVCYEAAEPDHSICGATRDYVEVTLRSLKSLLRVEVSLRVREVNRFT